jgi:hypothetical protein
MSWDSMNLWTAVPRYLGYGRDHACPLSVGSLQVWRYGERCSFVPALLHSYQTGLQMSLDAIIKAVFM